jgi:hypothetical protein
MLERETDSAAREGNVIRFVRLRRPLAQLLPDLGRADRRDGLEELVADILTAPEGGEDPRMQVNLVIQGEDAGLAFILDEDAEEGLLEEEVE